MKKRLKKILSILIALLIVFKFYMWICENQPLQRSYILWLVVIEIGAIYIYKKTGSALLFTCGVIGILEMTLFRNRLSSTASIFEIFEPLYIYLININPYYKFNSTLYSFYFYCIIILIASYSLISQSKKVS